MTVGEVRYDVVPDLSGFAAKVAAGLGNIKPVKIKVDVDNSGAAKATAATQRAATAQTAIAARAAAQQNAIASRAAAQQAAIRARAAAQSSLLAQRTAAQQAAVQARAGAAAERAAQRQAAAAAKAAAAQAKAEGRSSTVAGNLAGIEATTAATGKLTSAESRLANAQGNAKLAAVRLANAQADHAAGSTALLSSQEAYARSLRSVSQAEQAAAAASAKSAKGSSFTGKVDTAEVQSVGRAFAVTGAAIGVGVGLAVRASANFESAMSGVASTGHYTQGQLELLSKAAVAGGQATKYSATEAAQGEAELIKAGLSVQQVLGGGLTGALNLAAAGNLSVADSASAAATAVNQFGLQGSDAVHVADRFTQVAGVAQGEVSDVAEAFKNGAVTAHQYGLSIDDASVVTAAFAKNGIVGAQAGTLMKSALTNLYAPVGKVKEALDKLGVSAYDAAGNARPVADVAEQLHAQLAPLNEDARNNALARIFGKETLQGGAILAQEGAAGLASIRAELDKFPTAAETAATKMDNLKGDVEQLTGSLETGLIKSGSGANGFLRDLAQGATSAVNGFTDLPDAVQKGALGVAAFASAGLLGAAGLIKIVSAAATAKTALTTLGVVSEATAAKTTTAFTGVAKGVGVAVAAFALLQGVGRGANALFGGAQTSLGEAGQAIAGLANDATTATPAIDKFFTFTSDQDLDLFNNQVNGLGDAFRHVNEGGGKVSSVLNGISSALGFTTQASQITDRFGQLDQTLTQMGATSAPQAAKGFEGIAAAAAKQNVPLEKLVALFPQYKQQLQDQATALGVTVPDSAKVYADWMGGKVPDAVLAAAKANPQAAASFGIVAEAADQSAKGFSTATTALGNLISPQKISADAAQALSVKLFGTAQAALSASQAQIAYAQAVKQAKASTGGGIDPKTDKGASNLSLLNQQASAYQAVASAQIAAGKSAGSVAAGAKEARGAFISNAEAMGVSSGKAKDLADKYGLIPSKIETTIKEKVEKDASEELTKLKALDGSIITPKIQALIDQGKYKQALGALKKVQADRRAKIKAEADAKGAEGRLKAAAKARTVKLRAQADAVAAEGALRKVVKQRKAVIKGAATGIGAAAAAFKGVSKARTASIKAKASGVGGVKADIAGAAKGKTATVKVKASGLGGVRSDIASAAKGKTATIKAKSSGTAGVKSDIAGAAKGKTATVKVQQNGAGSVQSSINGIHGKTVTVTVKKVEKSASGGVVPRPQRLAGGGVIRGEGGPRDDKVLGIDRATGQTSVMVSPTEFITNAAQYRKNKDAVEAINSGGLWDIMPRRAGGGPVEKVGGGGGGTKPSSKASARGPVVINIDLGPELGGIRRIIADEIDGRDEYSATLTRMGRHR
jgi:TP901 family phage tail tape measure protein